MPGGGIHTPWVAELFCVLGFEDHESRCAVSSSANGRSEGACDNGQVDYGGFGLQAEK
jgi:hypothetical protein